MVNNYNSKTKLIRRKAVKNVKIKKMFLPLVLISGIFIGIFLIDCWDKEKKRAFFYLPTAKLAFFIILATVFYQLGASFKLIVFLFSVFFIIWLVKLVLKISQNKPKFKKIISSFNLGDVLFLLFPFYLAFLNERFIISHHGAYHLTVINQIKQNQHPLFNSLLPFYPINNYWGYHLLLSVIGRFFKIAAPLVSYGLNIFSLFFSLLILKKLLKDKKIFALPILFSTNILYFCFNFIHQDVYNYSDVRLVNLYDKFLNFSAFPLAVFLFLSLLESSSKYRPVIFASLLIVHPVSAFFALLFLLIKETAEIKFNFFQLIKKGLTYLLFLLPVLVYLLPITSSFQGGKIGLDLKLGWIKQNRGVILATLLPIFLIYLVDKIDWKLKQKKIMVKTALSWQEIAMFLLFLLSLILKLPDNNQYKFFFFSSILLYLTVLKTVKYKAFLKLLSFFLYFSLLANFYLTAERYLAKKDWLEAEVYFTNQQLVLKDENKRQIVEEINQYPADYLVVSQPVHKNNLFIEAASGHYPLVTKQDWFTIGLEEERQKRLITVENKLVQFCQKKDKIIKDKVVIDQKYKFIILCQR